MKFAIRAGYYDYSLVKNLYLDFNHSTTHLGDRLFFWDLISYENSMGREVYISEDDILSKELYNALGLKVISSNIPHKDVQKISLKPKFLNDFYHKGFQVLQCHYIDFYSFHDPLSKAILNLIRKPELGYDHKYARPHKTRDIDGNSNVVLFNNYVDSGKFRTMFIDSNKLRTRAAELSELGYEIWHVGSKKDKLNDKGTYNFCTRDLRGETTIRDIVHYFSTGAINHVVSFDNFFLHLAELYEVPSDILFRGRFTLSARNVHFRSVNVGLERIQNKIKYI